MSADRVFVIGGGPAGLAAAIAARLEQFDVTLADPRTPPIDKACGEGIMPDGVEILSKLGVHIPSSATFPFHGIRYVEGGIVADARLRGTPGLAMCRTAISSCMNLERENIFTSRARVVTWLGSTIRFGGTAKDRDPLE